MPNRLSLTTNRKAPRTAITAGLAVTAKVFAPCLRATFVFSQNPCAFFSSSLLASRRSLRSCFASFFASVFIAFFSAFCAFLASFFCCFAAFFSALVFFALPRPSKSSSSSNSATADFATAFFIGIAFTSAMRFEKTCLRNCGVPSPLIRASCIFSFSIRTLRAFSRVSGLSQYCSA